jgi:hypothetical protein
LVGCVVVESSLSLAGGGGGGGLAWAGFETGVDDTLEILLIMDPRRFASVTDDDMVRLST